MHHKLLFKKLSFHNYPVKLKKGPENLHQSLQFPSLSGFKGLGHRIFTRQGGVSSPPYNSLNTSYQTGDRPVNVEKNLAVISRAIGAEQLFFMSQVHGRNIILMHKGDHSGLPRSVPDADAVITDRPYLAIMVKQADCQGIILYDPVRSVVAVAHCGWRGNVENISGLVVDRMCTGFGCDPSDILACIGPSLGPCCAEFTSYREIFPGEFRKYMVGECRFDLWGLSRDQLAGAGVSPENIEIAGVCTRCNTDLFYSYRAENTTGRFATVAMLLSSRQRD